MKNTILSKVKDNSKLKLNKYSDVTYTKNKRVKITISNAGLIKKNKSVTIITSDSSGRSFEKSGRTKVWICEAIKPNSKSKGSTVARKTK